MKYITLLFLKVLRSRLLLILFSNSSNTVLLCWQSQVGLCERRKNSRQTRSICRQQFANVFADFLRRSHIQTFQPPSHANLEVLKNKPRKTWRLGPQTWRLQNYASNNNNDDRLFVSEYSLPN